VTESVVLPPDVRDDIMSAFYRPPCPKCKTKTMLARNTQGPLGFDIRTFKCPACDHVYQRVFKLGDPMKSREVAGWFRGLHAPT
jgi:rubredoxin